MCRAVAIIPARGGSKRIPRKNIKEFYGKPLIAYSISVALESKIFDKVVVSTDDKEIADIAQKYGAEIIIRPKELADDYTITWEVIDHAVEYLKQNGEEFDFVCTIYATAPFLQTKYLKEGFKKLKNSDAINAFSATSMPFPIQRTFKLNCNDRCEMFTPEHYSSRSQDLEEAYQDAGQFYWSKIGQKSDEIFFGKDTVPIILPRYLVQDIDTIEDWKRAEIMYKAYYGSRFDKWNELKQKLNRQNREVNIKEGFIFLMAIGQNIGVESYGKGNTFVRPVLVYKKFGRNYFLGIPLTSKEKKGSYFFEFNFIKNRISYAMFNQTKTFSSNRIIKYLGKISRKDFYLLKEKFIKLITT